jgi:hypothetical protein
VKHDIADDALLEALARAGLDVDGIRPRLAAARGKHSDLERVRARIDVLAALREELRRAAEHLIRTAPRSDPNYGKVEAHLAIVADAISDAALTLQALERDRFARRFAGSRRRWGR